MGLDIYLYSRKERAEELAHEEGWEAAWAKHHDEESGDLKPDTTEEAWLADKDSVPKSADVPSVTSERYPEHLFNRRYLRSSYNDTGFNKAVPDMLGRDDKSGDLYWIFEAVLDGRDEPHETVMDASFIPKLTEAKERALQVAVDVQASDPLRVMKASGPTLGDKEWMWDHMPTQDEVLSWYREELEKHKAAPPRPEGSLDLGEGYRSAKGEVFGFKKGLEILAVTLAANPMTRFSRQFAPGTVGWSMGQDPVAVLVYRMGDEGKQSYVESAEIIAEFCDEAIELIKADGDCIMHWSG